MQVGKVKGEVRVTGVLDEDARDDNIATTTMMTDTEEMGFDSDAESEDGADFAAEKTPRPPPYTIMYGGDGESNATGRDVNQVNDRGGQTKTGSGNVGEQEDAQQPTRAQEGRRQANWAHSSVKTGLECVVVRKANCKNYDWSGSRT